MRLDISLSECLVPGCSGGLHAFVTVDGNGLVTHLENREAAYTKADMADVWDEAASPPTRLGTLMSDDRPHSRACGIGIHAHGSSCHSNCPTCKGLGVPAKPKTHVESRIVCAECGQAAGLFHKGCDGAWVTEQRTVTDWVRK